MSKKPSDQRRKTLPKLRSEPDDPRESTKKIRAASNKATSSKGRDRPFLIVIGGGNAGEMHALRQSEITIGRARGSSIRLDDDGVSRSHAKVLCLGAEVHIEDLKSANGTFVNDEPIVSRRPLKDGDKITLGSITILKFTYSDDLDESFQRRMFEAALRDGLTTAYNKRYFMERMAKELAYARRHGAPLSLIMIDIDHFKSVNDTFGHPAGDAVLIQLSKVVHDTLRTEDVFARYGGEEFAVICRGVNVARATIVAERLRELVASMRTQADGQEIAVTLSLGVAGFPGTPAEKPEELIASADEALYEAKHAGRNRVVTRSGPEA
jgi:two-component system, cell cycle response regulator